MMEDFESNKLVSNLEGLGEIAIEYSETSDQNAMTIATAIIQNTMALRDVESALRFVGDKVATFSASVD